MVTLSVPGVLSRSRSQPPAGSQSPDRSRSPLQLPGSTSLSELPHTMAQQPLDPIESQFELLSPGGLIMMKYSVLYLKTYYLLHDTIVATKTICTCQKNNTCTCTCIIDILNHLGTSSMISGDSVDSPVVSYGRLVNLKSVSSHPSLYCQIVKCLYSVMLTTVKHLQSGHLYCLHIQQICPNGVHNREVSTVLLQLTMI